jgi:cysteine desulfurase
MSMYFDYAAATPIDERVLKAMQPYFSDRFYNPSAQYLAAKAVAKDKEAARAKIAHWLGARPAEVIFTAGGTEANNLAIHGIMQQFPDANIVVSSIEHESVLEPAGRYDKREAPVTAQGVVDLAALEALIDDKTVLISIMYANNEIGTIQPLREVAELLKKIRKNRSALSPQPLPLYFHADACQAVNYLHLSTSKLGVDLMTINAGKIYGPKQCGVLYVKAGTRLQPQILGGGQEGGYRSGTENLANIIGFAEALDMAQEIRHDEGKRLAQLQELFFKSLEEKISNVVIGGARKHRLPNNVHIMIPGQDNERLMMQLDEQGIQCATGSACSASSQEASHVLTAIGCTDAETRSSLRFTMGRGTKESDIHHVATVLAAIVG